MEIIYGCILIIVFFIGFGLGLFIPFFIKKYTELILKRDDNTTIKEDTPIESGIITTRNLTKEIRDEWLFGKIQSDEESE